jgi:5-keto 4-deoxyuronate isomerase
VKTKYTTDNIRYRRMTTDELREAFIVQDLFDEGAVVLTYSEVDRAVIGSAVPLGSPLELKARAPSPSMEQRTRWHRWIASISGGVQRTFK